MAVDAWQLFEEVNVTYVRCLGEMTPNELDVANIGELKFDLHNLKVGNRLRHEFRFNHGIAEQSAADMQSSDIIRTVAQQQSRLNCFLPSQAIEPNFVNVDEQCHAISSL